MIGYDSLGRKTSMIDPDMGAWSYGYDANGNLTSQTDANSQTMMFAYDNLDRLTTKAMPGGWVSNFAYDETSASNKGIGHRISISTALNGAAQTYKRWEYDARGRTTLVGQSTAGVTTDLLYTYDSADRITTMNYYEAGETVSYSYDAGWRPETLCSSIAGQNCYVSSANYSALDQPDTRTTGNGVLQDWGYDATTARLSSLNVSKSATTFFQRTYAYDNADNVTGITDPRWPQTQHFAYDERDRLTHAWTTATLASAPLAGPALAQAAPETPGGTALTADLGALAEQRDAPAAIQAPQVPGGSGKALLMPPMGGLAQTGTRIKDITFEGGSLLDSTTGVDSTSGTVNLETSAPLKGSYSATIPNNSTGYLTENFTGVDELFVSFYVKPASFPASSARIAQIQNSGTTVGTIYLTSAGILQLKNGTTTIGSAGTALTAGTVYRIGLHQALGSGSDGVLEAFVATGDAAFGTPFASSATQTFTTQASKFVFGATNSNAVNATFDDILLDSAAMPGPSGGGISPTATPTNTPTNTPTGPTATPTNTPTGAATATPTNTPTNTPTATATPVPTAPPAYDISMTYDALGNITSKTGMGSYGLGAQSASCPAGALDKAHAVVSTSGASYCYDRNGNMQSGAGWTYCWNADNTLASMTNGTAPESYTYDADGERVLRTAGGVTTVFFEGVWEQTTAGARKLYYTFNGQVVAMRDSTSNTVTYLHGDHLGSVSAATNSTGTAASTQEFDPWGKVRSGGIGATSLNYTGQRLDATGLLYYHARYYNPVLSRFVSADTIIPGQSHRAGAANPQELNRFSYVNNNPIRYTDPSGHAANDGKQDKYGQPTDGAGGGACNGGCPQPPPTPPTPPTQGLPSEGGTYYEGGVFVSESEAIVEETQHAAAAELEAETAAAEAEAAADGSLPDEALVCRGGTCTADRFANGSGVTTNPDGTLSGVSVQSGAGKSVSELTNTIPNGQVGVTTVGDVRAAGGNVYPSPRPGNPYHCTMCGITPQQGEDLFTPTIRNPNR
jgi:RHS repeat-associated protein